MSRIAVTPYRGDDVEKFLSLPLKLVSGASKIGRGIASMAGKTSIGQGLSAAKEATGVGGKIKAGVKAAGKAHAKKKMGLKEGEEATGLDALSAASQSLGDAQANAQAKKDEQTQGAMDAARRHAEISTNKGEPMDLAWLLLKELYLEPTSDDADYDGLKRDLKNFSGSYNIKTDGDSMKLENVASDDKDMVKRIAQAYGHSATNEPQALEEIKETSYPHFHSGYLG